MSDSILHVGRSGSDVYLVRDVFTKIESSFILNTFLNVKDGFVEANLESGQFSAIQITESNAETARLVVKRLEESLFKIFGHSFKKLILPDTRTSIKLQSEGQRHPLHSDSAKTTRSGNLYGDSLAYSGILSLSDDYEGGEINFPGDKVFLKLDAGSALLFPSHKHIHQVETVKSGIRYTFLTFWEHADNE